MTTTSRTRDNTWLEAYSRVVSEKLATGVVKVTPSTTTLTCESVMSDVVTPDFRERSSKGELIFNPMERIHVSRTLLPAAVHKQRLRGSVLCTYDENYRSPYMASKPWLEANVLSEISRLEALSVTDAYADVGMADIELLTELAELKETLGFIWSPIRKAFGFTRRLRRYLQTCTRIDARNKRSLARRNDRLRRSRGRKPKKFKPTPYPKFKWGKISVYDIPSAWLAYRYAIMPIIYTCGDIAEHVSRIEFPDIGTARAVSTADVDLALSTAPATYCGDAGCTIESSQRVGTAHIKARAGVVYKPDWSIGNLLGTRLHRVPATVYELIPLSFVADWFWNAASVYDAFTVSCRALEIKGSWVTTTIDMDFEAIFNFASADAYTTASCNNPVGAFTGQYKRRRLTSLSDVRLLFRTQLNANRIADAFALIGSFLNNMRKS